MTDLNSPPSDREKELNEALEALHFAFRAIVAKPDTILAERGLSRVHHRILYFIGRKSGLSVNELLATLEISKQSLNNPLRQLTQLGLVESNIDTSDRRIKRLSLTPSGLCLESQLSDDQRQRFARVFKVVGREGENTWRKVMHLLAEDIFAGE